jgi:hypothetical protein
MIYFLIGNDNKKKNQRIKMISGLLKPIQINADKISKEILLDYAFSSSLFGDMSFIVVDDFLSRKDIILNIDDLKNIEKSKNIFIFSEDSVLATEEKKYKKYAEIEYFDKKEEKKDTGKGVFAICDAFARKDKIGAWVLYREAIEKGITPENISGILFWKIKSMILNNNKAFSLDTLKKQSSQIVTLHHRAHRGELDFVVGLEQFILEALS